MSAVPQTTLDPFHTGFPVVIKTTPTFEPGAPISSITGVPLTARIKSGTTTIIGATEVVGGEVTMTFPALTLKAGHWTGMLSYADGPLATFSFAVEKSV